MEGGWGAGQQENYSNTVEEGILGDVVVPRPVVRLRRPPPRLESLVRRVRPAPALGVRPRGRPRTPQGLPACPGGPGWTVPSPLRSAPRWVTCGRGPRRGGRPRRAAAETDQEGPRTVVDVAPRAGPCGLTGGVGPEAAGGHGPGRGPEVAASRVGAGDDGASETPRRQRVRRRC